MIQDGRAKESARRILRGLGAGAAMITIALLLAQIAHRLVDRVPEPEHPETVAEAPAPPNLPEEVEESGLRITAIEPVGVKVESDGEVKFDGTLCAGQPPACPESTLSFPAARQVSVEVADLTRVRVIYNGARVEPLGNLSTSRRLVFINDSAP